VLPIHSKVGAPSPWFATRQYITTSQTLGIAAKDIQIGSSRQLNFVPNVCGRCVFALATTVIQSILDNKALRFLSREENPPQRRVGWLSEGLAVR
jgi:hypothetical protein